MKKSNSSSTQKGELTREEKLKAVVNKAIGGGYRAGQLIFEKLIEEGFLPDTDGEYNDGPYDLDYHLSIGYSGMIWFLFLHDFAKAFFGKKDVCDECGTQLRHADGVGLHCPNQFCDDTRATEAWQYNLQQAVLSTDPLKYYYDHI